MSSVALLLLPANAKSVELNASRKRHTIAVTLKEENALWRKTGNCFAFKRVVAIVFAVPRRNCRICKRGNALRHDHAYICNRKVIRKMKKETLKNMKRKARQDLGPIPPQKVEKSAKQYTRKPRNNKDFEKEG